MVSFFFCTPLTCKVYNKSALIAHCTSSKAADKQTPPVDGFMFFCTPFYVQNIGHRLVWYRHTAMHIIQQHDACELAWEKVLLDTVLSRSPVLNARETDTDPGVTVSPGCCAEEWDTLTPRRVKTSSAIGLFVLYSFAHLDLSRYCNRFSMEKTTSRGKCCLCSETMGCSEGLGVYTVRI